MFNQFQLSSSESVKLAERLLLLILKTQLYTGLNLKLTQK